VKTAYLGQYMDETANDIVEELVKANIPWTYKQASAITRALFAGEWGTRLFVDATRLDEAREIAKTVTGEVDG
jgi:hypothetical protein